MLKMWTIYEKPVDFPDAFVVRLVTSTADGPEVHPVTHTFPTLQAARKYVAAVAPHTVIMQPWGFDEFVGVACEVWG
jgi:hypothetical protein